VAPPLAILKQMELKKINTVKIEKVKKGEKMKGFLSIVGILLIFVLGCSNQENSITSPISSNTEQFDKVTLQTLDLNTVDEIVNKLATTTKIIDGTLGGTISLVQNVVNSEGREVQVDACFRITPGAFNGTQSITMRVDVNNGSVSFFPQMVFNRSCLLNFSLSNMNLANIGFTPDDKKAKFVYFGDDGTNEPVNCSLIFMDYSKGSIRVHTALINHFSRYGFVR
jgi:hypothetical protein